MSLKLGLDCKAYFGIAGAQASTLIANIKSVTINMEKGEADVTVRGGSGWRMTVGTLKDGSVEFEMVWDTEDAFFAAMHTAYFGNTNIALMFLDGALGTAGSQGLDADFSITNFTRNEQLEEAVTVNVTVKPSYSTTHPPVWTVIAGG